MLIDLRDFTPKWPFMWNVWPLHVNDVADGHSIEPSSPLFIVHHSV